MLPDGWKRQPLANIAVVIQGVAKGKKGLIDPIELPYLRVANVQDGYIDLSIVKTIQIERTQIDRYSLQYGDVLMTEGGDFDKLGRGDIWRGQITPCLHQNHVFAVRPDQTKIIPYYLSTLAGSHYGKTYFLSCAKKSTNLASINSTQLKEFPVLIPPIPEQQKIAQILSTWDKTIAKLEALIAAKQKRKKALMQQLLTGKQRLAGFDGEWNKRAIKQMGKVVAGGTPDTNINKYWDGDILWMTPTDVTALQTRFISNTKRKITQEGVKNSSATVVPSGSLLVCTRATIGVMSISTTDITTNQGFKNLVPSSKFDVNFLYYLFNFFKKEFIRHACGSTFFELSKQDFEKLVFECPVLEEQQKIAAVLSFADNEITTHKNQLAALKQQKQGLMQQLLTGKVRVKLKIKELSQ